MKRKLELIFDLFVLLFFALYVWEARGWAFQARMYPWVVGIPMTVLAAMHLVSQLKSANKKESGQRIASDFQFTTNIEPSLIFSRTVNIFSWMLGFLLGLWLFGYSLTIPAVTFFYLKIQTKESWPLSIILASCAWLIFWLLFDRTLLLPFPEGQLFLWLEESWQ